MNLYKASYYWHGSYGAYEEKEYVVVAETKEVALGLVLEAEPKTPAELWTIEEINNEIAEAHYISSGCD